MGVSVVLRGIGMMLLLVACAGVPALAEEAGTAASSGQKAIRASVAAPVSDKLSTMKNAAIKGVAIRVAGGRPEVSALIAFPPAMQ